MSNAELFYWLIGTLIGGAVVFMIGLGIYIRYKMKNPPPEDSQGSS